jgi:hypothetical protein
MKYILFILLIIVLAGCNYSAGHTARVIGSKVKKCCSSFYFSADTKKSTVSAADRPAEPFSVFSASVLERNGQILTW